MFTCATGYLGRINGPEVPNDSFPNVLDIQVFVLGTVVEVFGSNNRLLTRVDWANPLFDFCAFLSPRMIIKLNDRAEINIIYSSK